MEWAALIVIIIVLVFVGSLYYLRRAAYTLRRLKTDLDKDWLAIELLLKQRNDELPRLIQTSRSYMPEEGKTLRLVADARAAHQSARTMREKARADAMTLQALQSLFARADQHPELKSNSSFTELQSCLLEIEERVSERRELFNGDTRRFNARLGRPPWKWVRRKAQAQPRELFEVDPPERPRGRAKP